METMTKTIEVTKTTEELIKNLFVIISKKNTSEKLRDYMQSIYSEKQMVERKVDKILKGQIMLNTLTESELGVWCVYLYEFTSDESINPIYYYPELKIERIKQYYNIDAKKTKTDRIVLKNVVKVNNQYLCPFISYADLALYMGNGLIEYNLETQRDPNVINVKGELLLQPNINWTSVKEISEIIIQNNFIANLLTFNVLRTSNFSQDSMRYDEKEKTLTIFSGIQVLDGFHRIIATLDSLERAEESNISLNYGFMVSVVNLSERDAKSLISREDKRNPIDKEYTKVLEKNSVNIFIDAINQSGETSTNEMKNKIANSLEEVGDNNKYTTYSILNTALNLADLDYSIPSRTDDYLETFITVFNTIIGEYLKKYNYTEIDRLKKECVTFEANIFAGYVGIAKELLGTKKEKVKKIIKDLIESNELNLDRKSEDWNGLEVFKKNPKSLKPIYDYFKTITINNLQKGGE